MAANTYGDSGRLLAKGPLAPSYYFFGPVDALKDDAIAGLLDRALDPSLRDFNFDQRSASQLQPEDVETLCTTLPMMADRRVVIIREVEWWAKKARAKAAVLRYLDRPSPETVLILVQGSSEPAGDAELVARTQAFDFQPLEAEEACAEEIVGHAVGGLDLHRLLEPGDRLLPAVEIVQGFPQAEVRNDVSRIQRQHLLEEMDTLLEPANGLCVEVAGMNLGLSIWMRQ